MVQELRPPGLRTLLSAPVPRGLCPVRSQAAAGLRERQRHGEVKDGPQKVTERVHKP